MKPSEPSTPTKKPPSVGARDPRKEEADLLNWLKSLPKGTKLEILSPEQIERAKKRQQERKLGLRDLFGPKK